LHELQNNLGLIGISEGIHEVRDLILRVAPTDSTVIILGETGTGKNWWPKLFMSNRIEKKAFCENQLRRYSISFA
jgi:transcriptional regulator with GAF, ATPase, and Fis domain